MQLNRVQVSRCISEERSVDIAKNEEDKMQADGILDTSVVVADSLACPRPQSDKGMHKRIGEYVS